MCYVFDYLATTIYVRMYVYSQVNIVCNNSGANIIPKYTNHFADLHTSLEK